MYLIRCQILRLRVSDAMQKVHTRLFWCILVTCHEIYYVLD